MPGLEQNQLNIRYENEQLIIYGKVDIQNEDVKYLRQEYGIGDFYRAFSIGESIDTSKITAEVHNGVLRSETMFKKLIPWRFLGDSPTKRILWKLIPTPKFRSSALTSTKCWKEFGAETGRMLGIPGGVVRFRMVKAR